MSNSLKNRIWWIGTGGVAVVLMAVVFASAPRGSGDGGALAASIPVPELPSLKGTEIATLTAPPDVPAPISRNHATRVIVDLEVIEKTMRLDEGVDYTFWTFGGTVPGSFIRVREGDLVEFHLKNHHRNGVAHNIDLHAANGPGGGAEASLIAPGEESVFEFRALNPGLYVYHCATAPVGIHIANGMYGLILVEPKEGLPTVDREFYVMQSEFYTKGAKGEKGLQPFSMEKAVTETPDYVVFNGAVGSMVGDAALRAKKGETVRMYVGNGGPNLISSFHVIGEVFDNVYTEGGSVFNQNVQTTMVPAGGAAVVEFRLDTAGKYVLVDHSIFRAFGKGALAIMEVSGGEDHEIFAGRVKKGPYTADQ